MSINPDIAPFKSNQKGPSTSQVLSFKLNTRDN